MIRALLAVAMWLAATCAGAQTPIRVTFGYTPGAAAYASSLGTTVPNMVSSAIGSASTSGMNKNLADSGIPITIVNYGIGLEPRSPADTASMGEQIYYGEHGITPLITRASGDGSSIYIQISDPGALASFDGAVVPGVINPAQAVGAVPIRGIQDALERTIARIIAGPGYAGYATRQNRYGYQGYGNTFCAHTREADPLPTSTVVPVLVPSYQVNQPGYSYLGPANSGPTPQISCTAFQVQAKGTPLCSPNPSAQCASGVVTGVDPNYFCAVKDSTGTTTSLNTNITKSSLSGSSTITCTEAADNRYSSPSLYLNGMPLGDSTHNNVALLSDPTRITQVSNWSIGQKGFLRRAQEAVWFSSAWWQSL